MTFFIVRISCPDCTGQDDQGCFDGATSTVSVGDIKVAPVAADYEVTAVFSTREAAEEAGRKITQGSIWTYEVVEK